MAHAIARILIKYGGDYFAKYQKLLDSTQPVVLPVIPVHTSNFYPLQAMNIDESSISGVISVMEAIFRELEVDINSQDFVDHITLVAGDLKSGQNLRAAQDSRMGQEEPKFSLGNLEVVLGLFHAKMAAVAGTLTTHLGDPTAGKDNPGSLFFHNGLLERMPFLASSLPPFATSKDLIMDSLAARVIHCLLRVSKCATLDDYIARLESHDSCMPAPVVEGERSWQQLLLDADAVYNKYANASVVSKLQAERLYADSGDKAGDMVYEGAVLFMRHALHLEELFDAIKCGHSGRVVQILKLFALSFRGSGRPQYAREMLRLIHYIEVVWPPKLRELILQNWLVNPTGRPRSFVELDLVQEHFIFWIKVSTQQLGAKKQQTLTAHKRMYSAHGSNQSWKWLLMITPCIAALRTLTKDLNGMIGNYRTTRHSSPDKMRDILKLIDSLKKYEVYNIKPGRTFDNKGGPVVDAESVGLEGLLWGNMPALTEYNKDFRMRQQAYRGPDITKTVPYTTLPRHPGATATSKDDSKRPIFENKNKEDGVVNHSESSETDRRTKYDIEGAEEDDCEIDEADCSESEEEQFDETLPLETEEDVDLDFDVEEVLGLGELEDQLGWDDEE
ncbi:hypothetical protein FRC10_009557 [Ceratobasidium sp. 414]|nr:hypothetical protein FRC10_009557 [Ceratobasidium sp. 414]